jgi:hypothetical protein
LDAAENDLKFNKIPFRIMNHKVVGCEWSRVKLWGSRKDRFAIQKRVDFVYFQAFERLSIVEIHPRFQPGLLT